jgi:hypothetical protein
MPSSGRRPLVAEPLAELCCIAYWTASPCFRFEWSPSAVGSDPASASHFERLRSRPASLAKRQVAIGQSCFAAWWFLYGWPTVILTTVGSSPSISQTTRLHYRAASDFCLRHVPTVQTLHVAAGCARSAMRDGRRYDSVWNT